MGSLFNSRSFKSGQKKRLTKGQRLGWKHESDYEPVRLSSFSNQGEKLVTYAIGPFSTNKLVP